MKPAKTLTTPQELVQAGLLAPENEVEARAISARYAIAISPTMADVIKSGAEAVARQFLPDLRELQIKAVERADPIGDHAHSPLKGLVHRYPDRVLIKVLHSCPVYCRFCFRREMVGPQGDGLLDEAELDAIFAYIAARPQIHEVIFTGGDPLMLSARRIRALGLRAAKIEHLALLRWHSRVPVVAPERITPELARALIVPDKATYVSIHANHVQELTPAGIGAIKRLSDHGVMLLGQTVLLKGVNDTSEALADLFRAFIRLKIKPTYLHHPDLAPGTSHFRLSIAEGQEIYGALRGRISGHAIPAYVLDLPGGHGKVPIGPEHLQRGADGVKLRDRHGNWHAYPE
jgi:lysine 2,3-aminomutase